MVQVVMACCVLHNIGLRFNDHGDDFDRDDNNVNNDVDSDDGGE